MNDDEFFIKETLKLAKRGLSWTNPNPLAGAIIVKNKKIIGFGYHKKFGMAHAEVEAINSVEDKEKIKGATLYVNLEPCVDFPGKKTPACTDLIIQKGFKRVVCATLDPHPEVYGKGIEKLRKAGIETKVGLLEKEAKKINESYFIFHQKKRPFVAIKFAASLDGKIATKTGESKWITNEKARKYARKLRCYYQAVLVGINTILKDNPYLSVRLKNKKDPLKIILDPELKISLNSKTQILNDKNVIIVTTILAKKEKLKKIEKEKIPFIFYKTKTIFLPRLLEDLKERKIISILIEGGGETIGKFIDERLVDKLYAFYSPLIIGGKKAITIGGEGVKKLDKALHLTNLSFKYFDDNFLIIGYYNS